MAGSVLGIARTEVTPPFTAAAVPLSMVSLSSLPGSRRCTCISTTPGMTIFPLASIIVSALSVISLATLDIFPSLTKISKTSSRLFAGSATCPFLINIFIFYFPGLELLKKALPSLLRFHWLPAQVLLMKARQLLRLKFQFRG